MYSEKDIHDIAIEIFNDPNTINNYTLSAEDLSRVSESLYNISKTSIEGKIFLKNIKENAISFNEKEGLGVKPNQIESSSHTLWYGYNGKEGLFNLVADKDILPSQKMTIDDILNKKSKATKVPFQRVSSVADVIKNARMQVKNDKAKNNKDVEKER